MSYRRTASSRHFLRRVRASAKTEKRGVLYRSSCPWSRPKHTKGTHARIASDEPNAFLHGGRIIGSELSGHLPSNPGTTCSHAAIRHVCLIKPTQDKHTPRTRQRLRCFVTSCNLFASPSAATFGAGCRLRIGHLRAVRPFVMLLGATTAHLVDPDDRYRFTRHSTRKPADECETSFSSFRRNRSFPKQTRNLAYQPRALIFTRHLRAVSLARMERKQSTSITVDHKGAMSTSRSLAPLAGPTIPLRSIASTIFAARLYPTPSLR